MHFFKSKRSLNDILFSAPRFLLACVATRAGYCSELLAPVIYHLMFHYCQLLTPGFLLIILDVKTISCLCVYCVYTLST